MMLEVLEVRPAKPIRGCATVPGSGKAALPAMLAAALAPGVVELRGLPGLADVRRLAEVLRYLGVRLRDTNDGLLVGERLPGPRHLPGRLSSGPRGVVYALGLLAHDMDGRPRTIGPRLDLTPYAAALAGFGLMLRPAASGWALSGGPARPGEVAAGEFAVSALAAVLAATLEGRTTIRRAGPEPEVDDVLAVLNQLGAGAGRDGQDLVVEGPMTGAQGPIDVPSDRMYAGTLAIAAAAAGGWVELEREVAGRMTGCLEALRAFGVGLTETGSSVVVSGPPTRPARVRPGPYPEFPADLLPLLTLLAAQAPGRSVLEGAGRNPHVTGLRDMGARICVDRRCIIVRGPTRWRPARVTGAGARETCALYLAGRMACGTTVIANAGALARGYGDLEAMLKRLERSGVQGE
ncbi:hypothetical protein [Nonomuraea typhae]|uniref:UDP-N-acetylglucosamine 1-carboxyvinyltransferase n=1 Tax=Nonomuraea typhae TaxID=2603600 RepID=A0ABW7Z0X4_9ACTN